MADTVTPSLAEIKAALASRKNSSSQARLVALRDEIERLDVRLHVLRRERDELVRGLVMDKALTWREIAELGGFENPYIAAILRRKESA